MKHHDAIIALRPAEPDRKAPARTVEHTGMPLWPGGDGAARDTRIRRWRSLACWCVAIGLLALFFGVYDGLMPDLPRVGWSAATAYLSTLLLHGHALRDTPDALRAHITSFTMHLT